MTRKMLVPIVVLSMVTILLSPVLARAQTDEEKQRAGEHYKRGLQLYEEGAYEAALAELQRAYEIAPNYRVLYNIAQVQFQTNDFSAALLTFEKYLEDGRDSMTPERRTEVEKEYGILRDRVATVVVTTNVASANVFIDDRPAGKAPIAPVVLNIGRHLVRVEAPGYEGVVREVRLASRDRTEVNLTLKKKIVYVEKVSRARTFVRWSLGGATAGMVVGAATAGVLTLSSGKALDQALSKYPAPAESAIEERRKRLSRSAIATDVLTAGAVLTGVAFTLSIVLGGKPEKDDKKDSGPIEVGWDLSPTGVSVHSTF